MVREGEKGHKAETTKKVYLSVPEYARYLRRDTLSLTSTSPSPKQKKVKQKRAFVSLEGKKAYTCTWMNKSKSWVGRVCVCAGMACLVCFGLLEHISDFFEITSFSFGVTHHSLWLCSYLWAKARQRQADKLLPLLSIYHLVVSVAMTDSSSLCP